MRRCYQAACSKGAPAVALGQDGDVWRRYVLAWEAGDVDALLDLLKRDAILEMPPIPFGFDRP
jgi:hypothetical protein